MRSARGEQTQQRRPGCVACSSASELPGRASRHAAARRRAAICTGFIRWREEFRVERYDRTDRACVIRRLDYPLPPPAFSPRPAPFMSKVKHPLHHVRPAGRPSVRYGHKLSTPAIDALAARGTRTRAVQAPVCGPSRMSLPDATRSRAVTELVPLPVGERTLGTTAARRHAHRGWARRTTSLMWTA
jgi:hypothetical protein